MIDVGLILPCYTAFSITLLYGKHDKLITYAIQNPLDDNRRNYNPLQCKGSENGPMKIVLYPCILLASPAAE